MKYEGTRLDFTSLEEGYGLKNFEKSEIQDCLESFDRFVTHESWEDIAGDTGLYYKSYEPIISFLTKEGENEFIIEADNNIYPQEIKFTKVSNPNHWFIISTKQEAH